MAKQKPFFKIGFVLDGGLEKPDGVQQYILGLGKYYQSLGHSVRYIVAGMVAKGIEGAVSMSSSVSVTSNGNRLSIPLPASKRRIKSYLDEEKFDVLHIQTPYSPMMGEKVIFSAPQETAVVGTFHIVPNSWFLSVANYVLGKWCFFSLRRFDKMLSVSSAAQFVARRDFKINSDILPNIVDYERFYSAKPFSKYSDDQLNILFLGRLVPRKGCLLLLQAVKYMLWQMETDTPDFRVVICGSGPLEEDLRKYVLENDLNEIVEFTGFVSEEDKPRYYASADIAVFPSKGGESFGIVLLEALSSGKSVVLAGDNVGYHSVMAPKPELLFDANDAEELALKLTQYLTDEKERRRLGAWGSDYARQYDVKAVGDRLLDVYREALQYKEEQ